MYRIDIQNKAYTSYLNYVYNLPNGDKIKQNLQEPKILSFINSDKQFYLRSFLYRGLFDSDGSFSDSGGSVSFWSESPILIKQLSRFLIKAKIKHGVKGPELRVFSEDYRKFIELVGSSHNRKLNSIIYRLNISPKSYIFKGINPLNIENNSFKYEHLKFKGELTKDENWLYIKNLRLPLRLTKELLDILPWIIPQKSFSNACIIKRENKDLSSEELNSLIIFIESFFFCKVKRNSYTGALYIHSRILTKFIEHFFIYEKPWKPMTQEEQKDFYIERITFLEPKMSKFHFEQRKYEVLTRKEGEKTNPQWGQSPERRTIEELLDYGVIILNKPAGPT